MSATCRNGSRAQSHWLMGRSLATRSLQIRQPSLNLWRWRMFSVRWRKVLRDLWTNELRALLAILAIAIGIFGVGSILSAYSILTREINVNFFSTNPTSAILYVEGAGRELA